ncbi:RNA 2',3'-cyclic phosphodiesterase [Acuticoccus sp. I52.16.1]|uniref:RNA 2',3'-cyclic phosphodiesterase n=1 Tax=Acuticoccus sp. I52.16.1 TaxID=2928472 RepID=UPI001FD3FA6A|nr:RNA 2',3'-cyclic phosphodiesterase [Acuticoccus sp. I52.16.1]UOM33393.1 RNA 2',3'-cyclic phosphodiesterase [Acuticoccus sp. I52.16.1]
MPRLFTALTLPEDVRMWMTGLRGGLRGARFIDAENYHVTLRFIGDIDEPTADDVVDALSRIRRAPVTVRLCGLGSFGNKKQPHAVWARVEPTSELMELQADQERALQRIGLSAEARRFTPHVTIARCKGATARDVADWLTLHGGFSAPPFVAETFALLSSRASVGGGPYVTEDVYPLGLARAA